MMKKVLFFLTFLLTTLGGGKVYAFRYVITWHDGSAHQYRNDGGSGSFFTTSGDINYNTKFANQDNKPTYTDDSYGQFTFSYGFKMQNTTSLDFTITGSSTLTILKSTYSKGDDISSYTIKLHNNTTGNDVGTYVGTDTGNGYQEIRIEGLAAGSYSIKRASGESGLLYVRVSDDASMTMTVNETDLMYGAYNSAGARIQVTDEFAYVEPTTYSYSGNTWLRMKLNCSTALSAVTDVRLSSSKPSVIDIDDTSHDYFVNSDNLAVYYFVKVVGYSSDPVTITFTHTATNVTATKSFTVNPGTMTTYSSYPYKWDFRNNEWTSTRLQTTGDGANWSVTADEARNKGNISSSTVNMIKGLSFTASENDLCLDWKYKQVWMAAGTTITIPSLAVEQVITFNGSAGFATPSGVTRQDENKFYVNTAGDVTFTAPTGGIYLYSIDVSATGQATYHTTPAGVFEFTGNGTLAGGTVIKDVPGIKMTIGASGEAWTVDTETHIQAPTSTCDVAAYGGSISSGTFYKFEPTVNGYLTVVATLWGGNNIRIANGSGQVVYTYRNSSSVYTSTELNYPLQAGNTYYLYNSGENSDGYKLHLKSFSYRPVFLNTEKTAEQGNTVFAAKGSTTVFPSILTDANEYVTFAASSGGAITVDANGNGTPTLVTPTSTAYTITATIASPNSNVTPKTASYQLTYTATAVTLSFNWASPCNTDYDENGTYKNVVTATAGETNVTNDIETWTYTSSDPTIATVASDGTLTILNSGTIEITVTATDDQGDYQSATASYWLTIKPTITPTLTLEKGTTAKTIVYGKETYSNVGSVTVGSVNVEGPEITYESSNPSIATVNSSGVVTPVKPSATPVTITVRSSQYKQYAAVSQTYSVTVTKGTLTLRFIPEEVILNQGENITPYINFSGSVKSDIDQNITVTTSDASVASLQSPAYTLHTKMEGDVEKIDIIDVQITAASISGSSDQTATVTVSINGSDYYQNVSTTCKVKVRATAQKNFSWANGQETPVYTIYQGDFMMVPAISGNCSQNESYSLASNKKYAKKIKYDQSANMEDSKSYRAKEGVPDYLIVDADGSGNAPAANTDNSNTYAWILYARSESTRASAYPDSLMVYGKIDDGSVEHIVYLRAQDPNNTSYYCDAKIIIKPKSDLDTKVNTDVSGMSFPFTWDFTSISNDDMNLIANDNVYYENRAKINSSYTGYHLSTGFMNSQDNIIIKDGSNYRKTPSVEKSNNLYFQNFVVQDGNGALKTLKPFKGLKVSMAQTRYNSKVDRVRIFQNYLYFNGGPTEILLPSVESMPSSFKVFVKIRSNGSKPMYFKQGSGAKVTQSLSGSDQIVSFDATSAGGVITLQFQDCTVYWIACSTEAKSIGTAAGGSDHMASYSYSQTMDYSKSYEANNVDAYVATAVTNEGSTDNPALKVTLEKSNTSVPSGTGVVLKAEEAKSAYMIADARNVDNYANPTAPTTNLLIGTGTTGCTIYELAGNETGTESGSLYVPFYLSSKFRDYSVGSGIGEQQNAGYYAYWRVYGTQSMPANYSYLVLEAATYKDTYGKAADINEGAASRIMLAFDDDDSDVTGIDNVRETAIENEAWYTLQGVKVNTPAKSGIYIHKGKKVVVK